MTFLEAMKYALAHPSPHVKVFRPDQKSGVHVIRGSVSGQIAKLDEIDSTDWELMDIFEMSQRS